MKRPKQHTIDSQAQLLFLQSLPIEWVPRKLEPDYGIDYEVDIVEGDSFTGFTFYVQLKGTLSPKYTDASFCLSFEVDKLTYYSDKVNRPVFIIVADLVNNECLWLYAQRFIREVLRVNNPSWHLQKSVTLHIPKANRLSETSESLAQAAKQGTVEEIVRQFGRPQLRLVLEIEDKLGDPKAIDEAIKQHNYESASLKFELIDAYLEVDDRDHALRELENLFESTKNREMPEIHIESAIRLVHELGVFDPWVKSNVLEKCVNILDQALSRSEECAHKRVVLVARATKILLLFLFSFRRIMESLFFIDIATRSKSGMEGMLNIEQAQHWLDLQAADDGLRSLIHESIKSNEIEAACHITTMLAQAYSAIYPMIRLGQSAEISDPIASSAKQLLEYAEKLALSLDNLSLLCFVMQTKAILQFMTCDRSYESTLGEVKNIALSAKLRPFMKAADNLLQHMKSNEDLFEQKPRLDESQAPLSLEEEEAMIRLAAEMTRVNLEDDNDPVAQTINLAIRDLNPERILRFCEHLHILYTDVGGIFAQMYGLGSAGGKLVYCEIKDKAIEGMQLDGILEVFKWRLCEGCEKQSPRPEDWHWTREWQRERLANLPEGLERYLRRYRAMYGV
jgi:hypothetical protein